jgi:hypothetical protein
MRRDIHGETGDEGDGGLFEKPIIAYCARFSIKFHEDFRNFSELVTTDLPCLIRSGEKGLWLSVRASQLGKV